MDDRGGAVGFEGEKQSIACVGQYVLVAGSDEKIYNRGKNTTYVHVAMFIYDVVQSTI